MLPLLLQFFLFSDGTELSPPIPDSVTFKLRENYENNLVNYKISGTLYDQYGINVTLETNGYYSKGIDSSITYPDVPIRIFIADTFFVSTSGPHSLKSGMRYFLPSFDYIDLISLKSLKIIHRYFVWGEVKNLVVLGNKIYAENSRGKVRVIEIPDQ